MRFGVLFVHEIINEIWAHGKERLPWTWPKDVRLEQREVYDEVMKPTLATTVSMSC